MMSFADRRDAGRQLAQLLDHYRDLDDVLVLGLPRGGVPVAAEVAHYLRAPLDVMIVRKLGAPGQPELALGAVASGGVTVINEEALPYFEGTHVIERLEAIERVELMRRERLYRGERGALKARGRTVVLVDDGAATGASMLAAVRAVRSLGARKVVAAIPVASVTAFRKLESVADEIVCISAPAGFVAVGQAYRNFEQTTDEEVAVLLAMQSGAKSIARDPRFCAGGTQKSEWS